MYPIAGNEVLHPLLDLPEPDTTPLPFVLANLSRGMLGLEYRASSQWCLENHFSVEASIDVYVLLSFRVPRAHYLGPPNEDLLYLGGGHPLRERGLEPYTFVNVLPSPWIEQLELANRIHPNHSPERFASLHHYIFPFHEETFECLAQGYDVSISRKARLPESPFSENEIA